MILTRREFMALAGTGLGLAACGGGGGGGAGGAGAAQAAPAKAKPRALLILGGTGFLGPALVDAARARGHQVTLFNRGKTNPQLFPDVEKLHGDRDGHLEALAGRTWDAVIDTSGYVPRLVTDSAKLLAGGVGQYLFISTISVYRDDPTSLDERSPVATLKPEEQGTEKVGGGTYGPLKALCEQAAEAAMPGRTTVVRPGLIVGPLDPTDRFTYWPVRLARGGEVLAPGTGKDAVQLIDVRDLAAFCVRACEGRTMGTFNAVGFERELSMAEMLARVQRGVGGGATLTWAPKDFLEAQKVGPWMDMPVWVPGGQEDSGFTHVDNRKAIGQGLTFRPVEDTARDTLAWWQTVPEERKQKPLRAGLTPEREAEVLRAWHARR